MDIKKKKNNLESCFQNIRNWLKCILSNICPLTRLFYFEIAPHIYTVGKLQKINSVICDLLGKLFVILVR